MLYFNLLHLSTTRSLRFLRVIIIQLIHPIIKLCLLRPRLLHEPYCEVSLSLRLLGHICSHNRISNRLQVRGITKMDLLSADSLLKSPIWGSLEKRVLDLSLLLISSLGRTVVIVVPQRGSQVHHFNII